MRAFTYSAQPARVVFGSGTVGRVPDEVERLGLGRVLVVGTRQREGLAAEVSDRLGQRCAGLFAGAVMHTPVEVTEAAMEVVRARGVDGVVAIGGGSAIGLSKALGLRGGLPQIVIPTTYAGSEMTPILGQTQDGLKTTLKDPSVLPKTVIYDIDLTISLTASQSGASGFNAIAHAVEASYAQDSNPVITLLAREGIGALARALPAVAAAPRDVDARSEALYGAWLCGLCLGSVGMALHHKLCHVLGGSFGLPHAETHAVVLPHAVAYNDVAAREALGEVAQALGAADGAAGGLFDLAGRLGLPRSLRQLGLRESDIERAVELATTNPYWNPAPVTKQGLASLMSDAFIGRRPRAS